MMRTVTIKRFNKARHARVKLTCFIVVVTLTTILSTTVINTYKESRGDIIFSTDLPDGYMYTIQRIRMPQGSLSELSEEMLFAEHNDLIFSKRVDMLETICHLNNIGYFERDHVIEGEFIRVPVVISIEDLVIEYGEED